MSWADYSYDEVTAPEHSVHQTTLDNTWHNVCRAPLDIWAYQYRSWRELRPTGETTFSTILLTSAEFEAYNEWSVYQKRPLYCNGEYGEWETYEETDNGFVTWLRTRQWLLFIPLPSDASISGTISVTLGGGAPTEIDTSELEDLYEEYGDDLKLDSEDEKPSSVSPFSPTDPIVSGNLYVGSVEALSHPDKFDENNAFYYGSRTGLVNISKGETLTRDQVVALIGGQVSGLDSDYYMVESLTPQMERNIYQNLTFDDSTIYVERWRVKAGIRSVE